MAEQKKDKPNELYISRVYDAPVKAVWDAVCDTKQAAQWWGPRGFTITSHSKDLRPGGIWHYTMHGPDGINYPNKTLYHEVVKHEKLVYDHGGNDEQAPLFRVTMLFKEVKGKTQLEMTMTLPTPEAAKEIAGFIKKAGGNATWDRLAEYLTEQSGKQTFVINRSFPVSIEKLFDVWTDPKHFTQWLPPVGFTMKFINADIKPGGSAFFCMNGVANGMKMYGKIHYQKIEKPNRLVYTQQFADEKGNISRHPGAPTWPETMLTNVEFTSEGPERSRVTVTWEPHGKFTPEELDTFVKARDGMTQGWTGSFDKLDAYLAGA